MNEEYSKFIGLTIDEFYLAPDGSELRLYFAERGPISLTAYGDCCSESWIESIDNEEALIGVINRFEDIAMPDLGNVTTEKMGYVEQVTYYGLAIVTDRGKCVIDYRNTSNGDYGGSLEVNELETNETNNVM